MALNEQDRKKLDGIVNQMVQNGESDENIQFVVNDFKARYDSGGQPAYSAVAEEPGVVQGTIQAVAKPFLKAATTVAAGVASPIARMAGYSQDDVNRVLARGVDYGYFGSDIKPVGSAIYQYESLSDDAKRQLGWQGPTKATLRAGADAAGTGAEIASYMMAPGAMRAGTGFWGAMKAAAPVSAMFGAGTGAQAFSDTGSVAAGATQGAVDFVGSSLGFGLFQKAGQIFKHFGSKAIQHEGVRAAGKWFNRFLDKAWNTLPDDMKSDFAPPIETLKTGAQNVYYSLKKEFDVNWKTAADQATTAVAPHVADPDMAMFRYERRVAEELGNLYRESNKLYDSVKADETKIATEAFTASRKALGANEVPSLNGVVSKEQLAAHQAAMQNRTKAGIQFQEEMSAAIGQDLTLRQVLELNARALELAPQMSREEAQYAREFAAGLYNDAKKVLEKQGDTELVEMWDRAYFNFEKASNAYNSSLLKYVRSSGGIDNVIDKTLGKTMTKQEQEIFMRAMGESPQEVQDLFIGAVLEKARNQPTKEAGAKVIRDFMDSWGAGASEMMQGLTPDARMGVLAKLQESNGGQPMSTFLTPEQTVMLDDLATFYEGNFDDFVREMRTLTGVSKEMAKDLYDQQGRLNVQELIANGRLDDLSNAFKNLSNDKKFVDAVSRLSDDEKNALAVSLTKDMYEANKPFIALRADGTPEITNDMTTSFIKTWEQIAGTEGSGGNKAMYELFDDEQIAAMEQAYKIAKDLNTAGTYESMPKETLKIIMHGVLSMFYGVGSKMMGGPVMAAGAGHHAAQAAGTVSKQKIPYQQYMQAVDDLITSGVFQKNKKYTLGEFFESIAQYPVGQATAQTLEAATTGNTGEMVSPETQ